MKRLILFFIFLFLSLTIVVPQGTSQTTQWYTYQVTGGLGAVATSTTYNITVTGAAFHNLVWTTSGTVSTCSIQVDSSPDGTTWTLGGVITAKTCTSNGSALSTSTIVNFVRINLTVLSGGGSVNFNLSGYINNPAGGGSLPTGLSYVSPTLTISVAGSGNGALALSGNTSGTCTQTVDATSTTITIPCTLSLGNALTMTGTGQITAIAGSAGTPSIIFGTGATVGWYNCTTVQLCFSVSGASANLTILSNVIETVSGGAFKWSSTTASNGSADLTLCRQATGVLEVASGAACGTSGTIMTANYDVNTKLLLSGTAPTISSGFGTTPSIAANNGTAVFTVNVGTGGVATSGVIGLPTAATGWDVKCTDITTKSATVFATLQTASTTTTATIGNFNTSATAAAWVASDVLSCSAHAY